MICPKCGCTTLSVKMWGVVKIIHSNEWLTTNTTLYPSRQTCACGWRSKDVEYVEKAVNDSFLLRWIEANAENLSVPLAAMASMNRRISTQEAQDLNDSWPTGTSLPDADEQGLSIDHLNGYKDRS